MKLNTLPSQGRRGAIAPLAAFSLIFLIGMVAFSVDVSWMVSTQTELQNAADAAALAAASALPDYYVQYYLPNVTDAQKTTILANASTAAKTAARNCVAYHGAGGVSTLLLDETNDIQFGTMDSSLTYSSTYTFPNTVTVTVRRASTNNNTNGALNLFFAPIIGTRSVNLKASASATTYSGTMTSLQSPAGVLPMTYDIRDWNAFLATGRDPDGVLTTGSDGLPQLVVYPSVKDTGNFGELSLDDSHNGSSEIRGWIDNGISQAEVDDLTSSGLIPLTPDVDTWDWVGNTGFRSSVVQEINPHSGQTYILPLFKAYQYESTGVDYEAGNGNGSHYNYNIVGFVGIKIVSDPSDNRQVIIQPAAVVEPDSAFTSVAPTTAPASGSLPTTFSQTKLTR
jgi:Flp pilus assembly protein TadG